MKKMTVLMARHWGMCFGVRDALTLLKQSSAQAPITVLGELVHNPVVQQQLRGLGVRQASLESSAPVFTKRVAITAHGVSEKLRNEWEQRGHTIIDTTCPLVRSAHQRLAELIARGYFPVIIGQQHHVEVRGLAGDWPQSVVIEDESELNRLPEVTKIGVVSQTTQPWPKVQQLVERIREYRPLSEVLWCDTVCRPTKERQRALDELCAQVEVLVVVGGRGSNNTRQLAIRAQELGCVVYQVEHSGQIQESWFEEIERVGLTAGTSTLEETVLQVRTRLLLIAQQRQDVLVEEAGK